MYEIYNANHSKSVKLTKIVSLNHLEAMQVRPGGALLDHGMYGCIFTSSLHCKHKTPKEHIEDKEHPPKIGRAHV